MDILQHLKAGNPRGKLTVRSSARHAHCAATTLRVPLSTANRGALASRTLPAGFFALSDSRPTPAPSSSPLLFRQNIRDSKLGNTVAKLGRYSNAGVVSIASALKAEWAALAEAAKKKLAAAPAPGSSLVPRASQASTAPGSLAAAYATFELARGATSQEIQRKYLRLALKCHPDRGGGGGSVDGDAFKRLVDARDLLLSQTSARLEELSSASQALGPEFEALQSALEQLEERRKEREQRDEERLKELRERESRLEEDRMRQAAQHSTAFVASLRQLHQEKQQLLEAAKQVGASSAGSSLQERDLLADQESKKRAPPAVMLRFGEGDQYMLHCNRDTSTDGHSHVEMEWASEEPKMAISGQINSMAGRHWLLECQGGPLAGRSFILRFIHPYNTRSVHNNKEKFAEWFELLPDTNANGLFVERCEPRLNVRAASAAEVREKRAAAETQAAVQQAHEEHMRLEEEAAAEQERHQALLREKQRPLQELAAKQRELQRKRKTIRAAQYRQRLEASGRRTGTVLQIEYSVGEGSKVATAQVQKEQEAEERALTRLLDARWSHGKEDEWLRTALARLRAARANGVKCSEEFWERVDRCLQNPPPEFYRSFETFRDDLLREEREAVQQARALRRQVQEHEVKLLMAAQPGARNVEDAAIRAAQRPLAEPQKDQRVIVKSASALGMVISGQRGTVVHFSTAKQGWKVELDSEKVVYQPSSALYAVADIVASYSASNDDETAPQARLPSDAEARRAGKRPRVGYEAAAHRATSTAGASSSGDGAGHAVPAATTDALAGESMALPPFPHKAVRTGSDSDGYGSSLVSCSEDEEALEYARQALQALQNSRHARRKRREEAKRARVDANESSEDEDLGAADAPAACSRRSSAPSSSAATAAAVAGASSATAAATSSSSSAAAAATSSSSSAAPASSSAGAAADTHARRVKLEADDPAAAKFKRPPGRAPSGKVWDESIGRYVDKQSVSVAPSVAPSVAWSETGASMPKLEVTHVKQEEEAAPASAPTPADNVAAEGGAPRDAGARASARSRRARGGVESDAANAPAALGENVGALRREIRSLTAPATSAPARFEGLLRVGDVVKGRHMASSLGPAGTSWYRGTIVAVHEDGGDQTVDIKYDDGDFEEHIKREYVRAADGRGRNQH